MGQKNLAALTEWPYQRGFLFLKKMYGGFYQAAKKSGRNNEVAVRAGFTAKKSLAACETLYETSGLNKLTVYFWLNKSCS